MTDYQAISSTRQVQTTNDSSIVSKLSSANAGYFNDPCLKMFVEKAQKRSAVINRGYYIRFKAMESAFLSWFKILAKLKVSKYQIISLGAGFDSSYFRLRHFKELLPGCRYIEVDFPPVMKRKAAIIKNSVLKIPNFNFTINPDENDSLVSSSEDYFMLGIDLRNISELEKCLKKLETDFEVATLFLSECSVAYMDVESSENLIRWIQSNFPNSAFVSYEQVHPNDAFGIVMKNHFNILGCSLKSLDSFPTVKTQCERYKKMGWSACSAADMFEFFSQFPEEEKLRLQSLELFDEYEMWHETCRHYILLWAYQGNISLLNPFHFKRSTTNETKVKWVLSSSHVFLERFGHQIILRNPNCLLLSGGFGNMKKKHQRLTGLDMLHLASMDISKMSFSDAQDLLDKRMFHTATQLSNDTIVVLGGRSAPKKAFEKLVTLDLHVHCDSLQTEKEDRTKISSFSVTEKGLMPHCTWRHSASLVDIEGSENIVIFGGCSATTAATNECHVLNTQLWSWSKIEVQEDTPSPRHSHSAATWDKNKIVITGGLSADETVLSSVHVLDSQTRIWSTFSISGLLPRYSHTSHCYENSIILIGGITSISGISAGVCLINLLTRNASELSLPEQDPEYPILLSNHCSYLYNNKIVVIGGGGNCFSFGTHFNNRIVTIELNNLL